MIAFDSLVSAEEPEAVPAELFAEEQLHDMARRSALLAARDGYLRSGRGAVVVPWPPEDRLSVSFLPEIACVPLGDEVGQRIAVYEPHDEFVMIYLFTDGMIDAYTYRIPSRINAWTPSIAN